MPAEANPVWKVHGRQSCRAMTMLAQTQGSGFHREVPTPPESCEWPGKTGLVSLVLSAVEAVDWPGKEKNFAYQGGPSFQSGVLMALLTYCYATGICSSRDIEASFREDETIRHLSADAFPDWKTLRRFRKLHREPLKQCLLKVFQQSLLIRFGDSEMDWAPADHAVAQALDRWFEPLCVPSPSAEAEERLNLACFLDGMAMID